MKHYFAAGAAVLVLGLSACGTNRTPPFTGAFRVVNGITDSATLDASISNIPTDSQNISFGSASGIADIPEGSYDAQLTPSDTSKKFQVDHVGIDHNNVTTIFANGLLASGTQGGFTAEESLDAPTNGQAVIQAVHAAYQASQTYAALQFSFVPVAGTGAATTQPTTATFGQSVASIPLAGGKYEIVVYGGPACTAGNACPTFVSKVFDSGPDGVSLPASDGSNVFQIAAIDSSATQHTQYGSSIFLLLLDNKGGNTPVYNSPLAHILN